MGHLGGVIRRSPARHGDRRNQSRKPDAAEVDFSRECLRRQLLVVTRVIPAEVLAVELVGTVHRRRKVEVVFGNFPGRDLRRRRGDAVSRDTAREEEQHRPAVRLPLPLGEFQQVQRPLDVHLVGQRRRELRPRAEQRRQVIHLVDFVRRHDPLEEFRLADVARELLLHLAGQIRDERIQVQRHDRLGTRRREPVDEAVPDFAAGPGDQNRGVSGHTTCANGGVVR